MTAENTPDAVKVLESVLQWAEARCPCENEEPNPCPLCGASVENLEPCKSAENTLPRHLLKELRSVKARAMQAAMPAPAGVRVRKLEWNTWPADGTTSTVAGYPRRYRRLRAPTEIDAYFVNEGLGVGDEPHFYVDLSGVHIWDGDTIDEAKAAAQSDYEARILSAIEGAGAREGANAEHREGLSVCSCGLLDALAIAELVGIGVPALRCHRIPNRREPGFTPPACRLVQCGVLVAADLCTGLLWLLLRLVHIDPRIAG